MTATVAFVGLGMMGRPMAGHLVRAGFTVRVADASPAMLDAFCKEHTGAVRCSSAAEAAQGADILLTMLPNGAIVREVAMAADLKSGQLLLDMSSSAPMGTRALGEELAQKRRRDGRCAGFGRRRKSADRAARDHGWRFCGRRRACQAGPGEARRAHLRHRRPLGPVTR